VQLKLCPCRSGKDVDVGEGKLSFPSAISRRAEAPISLVVACLVPRLSPGCKLLQGAWAAGTGWGMEKPSRQVVLLSVCPPLLQL